MLRPQDDGQLTPLVQLQQPIKCRGPRHIELETKVSDVDTLVIEFVRSE